MEKKTQIEKMSPVDAYNKGVTDSSETADIKVSGDPKTMSFHNCSPGDIRFFDVDRETILKNLIKES